MAVQQDIDIVGWLRRWNMLQTKFQSVSHQIDYQWPLEIAVTISAHKCDARAEGAQLVKNRFRAHIAQMPDVICILGHLFYFFRQTIMRVCQNEDAQRFFRFVRFCHAAF